MTMIRLARLSVLAIVLSLVGACASTSDLEAVRVLAQQAQDDAQMAKGTANEALATANEAMALSRATDERINRMFKRSMLK